MGSSNANLFAKQITQVLSVEKLPLGFFIGAGCPVSVKVSAIGENEEEIQASIIPDVSGITKLVVAEFVNHVELSGAFGKVLDALREDGVAQPNIEQILGFVRTLTAAAGAGMARGLEAKDLRKIDKEVCKSIFEKVNKRLPSHETAYHALAQFIAPRRKNPVEIFTTNYDLLMEQALESSSVPYFDGFVGAHHPFFDLVAIEQDVLPSRWARLWKVHGSINWRRPDESSRVCRTMSDEFAGDLLIHPSHQKFDDSRRMPYLALIDRLRSFLRNDLRPVALMIHGFSFSDDHLNAAIEEGLRSNPHAACFAFQYGNLDEYPGARRLASRCPNLTVLARDCSLSRGVSRAWEVVQSPNNSAIENLFEWDQSGLEGQATVAAARLRLGDFAQFGSFLKSLTGDSSPESEMR
jgi:hypothetical protein